MIKQTLLPLLLLTGLASCNEKNTSSEKSHHAKKDIEMSMPADMGGVLIFDLGPVADDNKFPAIRFDNHKMVEDKINTFLQLEQLNHLPGQFKDNPFEKITYQEGVNHVENFYDYLRTATTENIFSITLWSNITGSNAIDNDYYYNFDLRTGNKISLNQLFTEDGMNRIAPILNQQIKKIMEGSLAKLKEPHDTREMTTEAIDELNKKVAAYESCIAGALDHKATEYFFYFVKDSITFEKEVCSIEDMLDTDESDGLKVSMAFQDLKPYLSLYGKSLLNGDKDNTQTSSPEGKLYRGFINGKYPIGAMISGMGEDGAFIMEYWYNKTKIPIELLGTFKGQHFSLTEGNYDEGESKEVAKVEADWIENKKIIGTWTNSKTNEVMKLELVAY